MRTILLTAIIIGLAACSGGNSDTGNTRFYTESNVAISGYDLVSYVLDMDAVKGSAEFSTNYDGAIFYFASAPNRDEFIRRPDTYLPAYGGWCAYTMAEEGEKVASDPSLWLIQDNKLLLFSDNEELNGKLKSKWVVKRVENKKKADANWEKVK
jgi:YHS domain-containing protein